MYFHASSSLLDDHSVDDTRDIGRRFGWEIYENPEWGVASGANEALRHVESPFFITFEQDILLARDWWDKIPKYMENPKVAIAQGVRVATVESFRQLRKYTFSRKDVILASLDNNIMRTKAMLELGGFPRDCPLCVDGYLWKKVLAYNYEWVVDTEVVSDHIRMGILQNVKKDLRRQSLCTCPKATGLSKKFKMLELFAFSPIRGLQMTLKTKHPQLFLLYPFLRFIDLKIALEHKMALFE